MILIGENIHITPSNRWSIRNRMFAPIQELARGKHGRSRLSRPDLGPARKDPEEVASWLVETVQAVTELLSLGYDESLAMEAGLKLSGSGPFKFHVGKTESRKR
jgi:hypothetical protein